MNRTLTKPFYYKDNLIERNTEENSIIFGNICHIETSDLQSKFFCIDCPIIYSKTVL